jgi:hypothetical protein
MREDVARGIVVEIVKKYLRVNHGFDSNLYERYGFRRGKKSKNIVERAHEAMRVLGLEEEEKQEKQEVKADGEGR